METAETTNFEEIIDAMVDELVPEPVTRSASFTPSEDYIIVDDSKQEKPVEKQVEQG